MMILLEMLLDVGVVEAISFSATRVIQVTAMLASPVLLWGILSIVLFARVIVSMKAVNRTLVFYGFSALVLIILLYVVDITDDSLCMQQKTEPFDWCIAGKDILSIQLHTVLFGVLIPTIALMLLMKAIVCKYVLKEVSDT